jgi:NADPH2:quinone reductase
MMALVLSRLADDFTGCALESIRIPTPKAGEALIRVRACGVHFVDLLMTGGKYQHKPELPCTLGNDLSGEIVALREDHKGISVGDSVVVTQLGGGFADYAVARVDQLSPKPKGLSFSESAAYGASYLTAYVALVRRGQLKPGEWVLVQGASGGVGLAALDLAKVLGARVIAASASDRKLATLAAEYAPDAVVNVSGGFKDEVLRITGGGGANIVYDPVGGDVFDESIRCIAFDGRILVVGFTSGRIPELSVNRALIKGISVVGVRAGEYGVRFPELGRTDREAVWRLADEGRIRPRVHGELPLSQWREAFDAVRARDVIGRIVLRPE